jgi:hypothetical protein
MVLHLISFAMRGSPKRESGGHPLPNIFYLPFVNYNILNSKTKENMSGGGN